MTELQELVDGCRETQSRVEALWNPIEQLRKDLESKVLGKVASHQPEYSEIPTVLKIRHVFFRGGRLWLEGPTRTKTGWHGRQRSSIYAGSRGLVISEDQ